MSDLPLADLLKIETKVNHQQLEKSLIKQMRLITTPEHYVKLLQLFYGYFGALEEKINEFILPHHLEEEHQFQRRKTKNIEDDIHSYGGTIPEKATDEDLPEITNHLQAFGALYVIEGSTLGGKVIAKMMQRQMETDAIEGFTFFHGYGDETESRWAAFKKLLNKQSSDIVEKDKVVGAADETFAKFHSWIDKYPAVNMVE